MKNRKTNPRSAVAHNPSAGRTQPIAARAARGTTNKAWAIRLVFLRVGEVSEDYFDEFFRILDLR